MTNLLRILFAGMAIGLAFSATARTAASPESPDTLPIYRPLTLDDALTLMLTENSALKAAAHEAHAAAQQRRAAIGLRMPQIGVTGAYTYLAKDIGFDFNHLKAPVGEVAGKLLPLLPDGLRPEIAGYVQQLTGADWSIELQNRSVGFVGGEVSVPIWLGGKINAANRVAKINEATVDEQSLQIRNALVSELVERYFGLALAMQVVDVRRRVVDGVRRHLADAEALEHDGMIAQSERLYVEFKLADAERELSDAQLQMQTIAAALNNTLGRNDMWRPLTAMFLLDGLESRAYFQELALEQNPLLRQVGLKYRLAEEGVKVQRADFLPQVAAVGGGTFYNYQVSGLLPRWAVGVGVRIKIFDGLSREYNYSAARATVRRVGELRTQAENDVSVLVEQLYNELMNYRNRMRSLDASLAFAESYLRMKDAAFREGIATSTELIDAELDLAGVQTERLQNAYNYDLMLARLLEAAGISSEFGAYVRRPDVVVVSFDKN